jgi:hypothetical protein
MLDLADCMASRKKIKYCIKDLIAKIEQNPNTPRPFWVIGLEIDI